MMDINEDIGMVKKILNDLDSIKEGVHRWCGTSLFNNVDFLRIRGEWEKKLSQLEQLEKERIEKQDKDYVKTDMICPKCGEKVFKHFHKHDEHPSQTYEWRWFWCVNMCDLDCGCCVSVDSHGDCGAFFCFRKSNWSPKAYIKG